MQCCFMSTGTVRDGEPRTSTSTFTQLLSSALFLVQTQLWFVDIDMSVLLNVHRSYIRLITDG